ncbi:MAG TPA: trigger factor [Marmoricola sp.]|nr:trigger factor [Marmoricola sp.]
MKSAVETLGPTRAKLTVEVPAEDLKPNFDAAYKAIAKQVNIPGFRKGKVPPAVIDRQIGRGAVIDQAVNDALPQLYVQALQDNDLLPVGQPDIEVTRIDDDGALEFTATLDVRPEINLPDHQGIAVEVSNAVVTDEDVQEQIEHLQGRFATFQEVARAATEGDDLLLDLLATKDGEAVAGGEATNQPYVVGSDLGLDGLEDAVKGLRAGEEADFSSTLVAGDLAGQEVDIHVKVTAVRERELPEVDDDFAQLASEFDTVEELRADVRTRLEGGKRLEQAAEARDAVLEKLLDQVEIPLPEDLVNAELAGRKQELEQQIAMAGMTMEQFLDDQKQTVDEFEAELEKRVRDSIASQFLLDQLVKDGDIEVSQEELTQHLMRRSQQSGQNPQEFIQHMIEHNHLPDMAAEVARGKALASVVESAEVKDADGNLVDLANLKSDGTIGEPESAQDEDSDSDSADQ